MSTGCERHRSPNLFLVLVARDPAVESAARFVRVLPENLQGLLEHRKTHRRVIDRIYIVKFVKRWAAIWHN